jgi:multiple sugar transport system permease protein
MQLARTLATPRAARGADGESGVAGRRRSPLRSAIIHLLLAAVGVMWMIPFIWMVSTSFKHLSQVFVYPPEFIPNPWIWTNYPRAVTAGPFLNWVFNSFRIAVLVTVGQLITCSLGGYAFARLRFPGRDTLFLMYLATMMIPGQVTIIPVFVMMNRLGWVDTPLPLIIPALASAWGTFLFRQFYLTLPKELEDAAKIDGCSYFRIYTQILGPLAKPIFATQAVFSFMGHWNDLFGPLIYLQTKTSKTLTVGLLQFRADYQGLNQWGIMMAGLTLSVLPILILFVVGQRYFVQGIALTGIKG